MYFDSVENLLNHWEVQDYKTKKDTKRLRDKIEKKYREYTDFINTSQNFSTNDVLASRNMSREFEILLREYCFYFSDFYYECTTNSMDICTQVQGNISNVVMNQQQENSIENNSELQEMLGVNDQKHSYVQGIHRNTVNYKYEKSGHLESWLDKIGNKDDELNTSGILHMISEEAKRERIPLDKLDVKTVKKYLKKFKKTKYNVNIISIICLLNGEPCFKIDQETKNVIFKMFDKFVPVYEKYKEPTRKNMISYSYLLTKFFEIIGRNDLSKFFILLKDEKLRQTDTIFKKVLDVLIESDEDLFKSTVNT